MGQEPSRGLLRRVVQHRVRAVLPLALEREICTGVDQDLERLHVLRSDVRGALGLLGWQADGLEIGLVGAPALCARYAQALARQGYATTSLDGAQCALAGLRTLTID